MIPTSEYKAYWLGLIDFNLFPFIGCLRELLPTVFSDTTAVSLLPLPTDVPFEHLLSPD